MKKKKEIQIATLKELEAELKRERHKSRFRLTLRSTIYTLIVVAALAVLVATIFLPVLRIYGSSMEPTINEGEIVVSLKGSEFEPGDIIALYYSNKILVKRYIGGPGQWINIDADGNVYVDGEYLDEPYLGENAKALGDTNISLPYQVPEGRIFVLGDNRGISQDSRNTMVGCIADEQIVGKIVFRVWPLNGFGKI